MKQISLFLMGLLLVSCNGTIETILKINKPIQLNTQYDGLVNFDKGNHDVKITVYEKSNYILFDFPKKDNDSIFPGDGEDWKNQSYEVRFKYPKSLQLPKDNGEFKLEPSESGQPLTLKGIVATTVNKGGLVKGYERCEIRERRTQCYVDGQGRTVCQEYWDTYFGRREVDYYPIVTTKTLNMELTESSDSNSVGTLSAKDSYEEREYVYQGFCR
jgi:hypothetical protein